MKAIILAAGMGRRLFPLTQNSHKCLISFHNKTLIERYIEILYQNQIREIVLVVGHCREKVMEKVGASYRDASIRYLVNESYERGNVVSMWLASREFTSDLLVMDADVVFDPGILHQLIHSTHPNSYLLDRIYKETGEEFKVVAKNGRVVENARKVTQAYDTIGEGLGILKISQKTAGVFKELLDQHIQSGGDLNAEYEEILKELLKREWFGFEDITGKPWIEIDFLEDINRAEQEILPKIDF